MKNIVIVNGRVYFTAGRKRYALTIIPNNFFIEESKDNMLISNNSSDKIEKKLKNL